MTNPTPPNLTPAELHIVQSGYCPREQCIMAVLNVREMGDGLVFNHCPACHHIFITKASA